MKTKQPPGVATGQTNDGNREAVIRTSITATSDWPQLPTTTRPATQIVSSASGWMQQMVSAIKPAIKHSNFITYFLPCIFPPLMPTQVKIAVHWVKTGHQIYSLTSSRDTALPHSQKTFQASLSSRHLSILAWFQNMRQHLASRQARIQSSLPKSIDTALPPSQPA